MGRLQQLIEEYESRDYRDLGPRQLKLLRDELKLIKESEITSSTEGKAYIDLVKIFRMAVAENDELNGENYLQFLHSVLSVGEDGLYANDLRFIFELIQNVDDCDYSDPTDRKLDMRFDVSKNEIILTYNEIGFKPENVFAITGIAEKAKNISSAKKEIGEKGIGFKSVFGVAEKVWIRSGWFSFEIKKDNFRIPIPVYDNFEKCTGTQMILYVPGNAASIYNKIKNEYGRTSALFRRNPILFLNKLTCLRIYCDQFRSMEFRVSRSNSTDNNSIFIERNVEISIELHDHANGADRNEKKTIYCTRYTYPVIYSKAAFKARYGDDTQLGQDGLKVMDLQVVIPNIDFIDEVGNGTLYSFLPTQLRLTVPIVCHVPFKLNASREFVDPQNNNSWFQESVERLSFLIDHVYLDYCSIAKENIILYLPSKNENLFAENEGKERCLAQRLCFMGTHYLQLPLFLGIDNQYHPASDIFCFSKEEEIKDPELVYKLMGYSKVLFNAQGPVNKFGIEVKKNVKDSLFGRAFFSPESTSQILDYLDSERYRYSDSRLFDTAEMKPFRVTPSQLQVMINHHELLEVLLKKCCDEINKYSRFPLEIDSTSMQGINCLFNDDLDINSIPKLVKQYLVRCDYKYLCLDIEEGQFLPCYNALILSNSNPLYAFAAFCTKIDFNNTLAVRIRMLEISNRLDQYVKSSNISPREFLSYLGDERRLIKDALNALGNNGYKKYIDLILKSGTDRNRFIQELLQNADDCKYPEDVEPTFSLVQNGEAIETEYNEKGFTRADIRAITAIGESTKNKLINGKNDYIGEKGVGFKTIFSVASSVDIRSVGFAFKLSAQEPTIPKLLKSKDSDSLSGTRMTLMLKDGISLPNSEQQILRLCLCLRKLKRIRIGAYTVLIQDTDDKRTITIGNKEYVFRRINHEFSITDSKAIEERSNGYHEVSNDQRIICYVPKSAQSNYPLYCGLPTIHKINIPMAIDAPFSLTTSREEIETTSAWNVIIRRELYNALKKVINELKKEERAKVFRLLRFKTPHYGNVQEYVYDLSDNSFINNYDFTSVLRSCAIIPTYERNTFAIPQNRTARRVPHIARLVLEKISINQFQDVKPWSVVDAGNTDYEVTALNALGCVEASFDFVYPIISRHIESFIQDKSFREALYKYLLDIPKTYSEKVKQMRIIPVYSIQAGNTEYISWQDNKIFVKPGVNVSSNDFYVLNEEVLSKSDCEKIFNIYINQMNREYERARYNEQLNHFVRNNGSEAVYRHLLTEYRSGELIRNDSFATLYAIAEMIPLKNELGEISEAPMFICNQPTGYFDTPMLKQLIVHKECIDFAKYMRCADLSSIHYEDIDYDVALTDIDIENLLDDYFENSKEILQGFYRDGLLSDDLIHEEKLEYLMLRDISEEPNEYSFPSDPVGDRNRLKEKIRENLHFLVKIVSVPVKLSVRRGVDKNGSTFSLESKDKEAREGSIRRYTPDGAYNKCFCQMCRSVKEYYLIEVNNIELEPKYYFPQLRLSLCLECSKDFEFIRSDSDLYQTLIARIKGMSIGFGQGFVDVPVTEKRFIRFTAKHLAEIQEILSQKPN